MTPNPRQARSVRTRDRLLEATVTCLVAHGYAGTTMQRVQREAGVSRGALIHHFATMDELLVGAIHHVARRQLDELGDLVHALDHNGDRRVAVRLLHSFMSGPLFLAGLELWMAARTTSALHDALIPAERELGRHLRATLASPTARSTGLDVDDLEDLLVTLRGLAVTSVLRADPALEDAVLERWIGRVGDRPRDGAVLDASSPAPATLCQARRE